MGGRGGMGEGVGRKWEVEKEWGKVQGEGERERRNGRRWKVEGKGKKVEG